MKENLYDSVSLTKIKENVKLELKRDNQTPFFDFEDVEYFCQKSYFLPYLKFPKEINLIQSFKNSSENYLKDSYREIFKLIELDSKIKDFEINRIEEIKDFGERTIKRVVHVVTFSYNNIEYEDRYNYIEPLKDAHLSNLIKEPDFSVQDLSSVLPSIYAINFLLADINSPKRFLVTWKGQIMKLYFIKKEIAKEFEPDICFADSYSNMQIVIDKFIEEGFLPQMSKTEKSQIFNNYRKVLPQILIPEFLICANTDKIKEFNFYDYYENKSFKWYENIEKMSKGIIKIINFTDNLDEYVKYIKVKSDSQKQVDYKISFVLNDSLISKKVELHNKWQKRVEEKDIFNTVLIDVNKKLSTMNIDSKFYYDGFKHLYFLNEKEKFTLKKNNLVFELYDKF
ncbi:hypothetical protein [Lacihabitans soyangensis]|uniref:Uncharacterized protein n=1 Tax=Lacihabitans soyangensis TaxID=869394 RepID=A0AAE3H7Z1_9BACT|nr:hypothetical protein [Lacihabitans soyangensis]MCP9765809.1 hypothetical protein [Lacihabitans soyangensis]